MRRLRARAEGAVPLLNEEASRLPLRAADVDVVEAVAVHVANRERGPFRREQMRHQRLAVVVEEGVLLVLEVDPRLCGDIREQRSSRDCPRAKRGRAAHSRSRVARRSAPTARASDRRATCVSTWNRRSGQMTVSESIARRASETEMQTRIDGRRESRASATPRASDACQPATIVTCAPMPCRVRARAAQLTVR